MERNTFFYEFLEFNCIGGEKRVIVNSIASCNYMIENTLNRQESIDERHGFYTVN